MLSTPLICCSIGVATDCSIVRASAPTYAARICTSGGAIWGNKATGSPAIVTPPTITSRIEITMATMGRLIKNFDIDLLSLGRIERLRIDLRAGPHLLDPLGHHPFAWLKAVGDDPAGAAPLADLHVADFPPVLRIQHRHLVAAL